MNGIFAFVATWWKVGVAALAAVLLSYQVGSCNGYANGKQAMETALAKANADYLQQKARADEAAATQRLTDTIAVNRQEQELRNAIASTPDTAPDAVRIALGCQRLRAAGTSAASLPAVCRSSSGAQAGSSR